MLQPTFLSYISLKLFGIFFPHKIVLINSFCQKQSPSFFLTMDFMNWTSNFGMNEKPEIKELLHLRYLEFQNFQPKT